MLASLRENTPICAGAGMGDLPQSNRRASVRQMSLCRSAKAVAAVREDTSSLVKMFLSIPAGGLTADHHRARATNGRAARADQGSAT
jgi:hypothetical protein